MLSVLCILLGALVYFLVAFIPLRMSDRSSEYKTITDIDNISDEQLLYIAANNLRIKDFQPKTEYIKIPDALGFDKRWIYSVKHGDKIKQYYYEYEDHYGNGAFSDAYDVFLAYDLFVEINGDNENLAFFRMGDSSYYIDKTVSGTEIKRIMLPDDWDFRIEEVIWRGYWGRLFLLRLVVIFAGWIFFYVRRIRQKNTGITKIQYATVFSATVLLLCLSECTIRMGIYTDYYMNSHSAVMGGFGVPFKWIIPGTYLQYFIWNYSFTSVLLLISLVTVAILMINNGLSSIKIALWCYLAVVLVQSSWNCLSSCLINRNNIYR